MVYRFLNQRVQHTHRSTGQHRRSNGRYPAESWKGSTLPIKRMLTACILLGGLLQLYVSSTAMVTAAILPALESTAIVARYSRDFRAPAFSYQTNDGPLHHFSSKFTDLPVEGGKSVQLNSKGGALGPAQSPDRNEQGIISNQFVVISYEVQTSGCYEIVDSFVRVFNSQSSQIQFRVFVNHGPAILSGETIGGGRFYFDTRIGYVARGDKIRIALGSTNPSIETRFATDFSVVRFADREHVVGNYRNEFVAENVDSDGGGNRPGNWKYFWNAPHAVDANPLITGGLSDRSSYQPLVRMSDTSLRPQKAAPSIAAALSLSPWGGHPGKGYPEGTAAKNRYAIAAFKVDRSGHYAISNSFLKFTDHSTDGVEVVIGTNRDQHLNRRKLSPDLQAPHFDLNLGNLSKGDTIYVAFGAAQSHIRDSFQTDFSILRILPRQRPLREIIVPASGVIFASDYGALPDDRKDDCQSIRDALSAAALVDGPVKLVFQPGVYNLDDIRDDQTSAILINRMNDFVFDGQGAQFFISDPTVHFINLWQSERVILRDFEVDYVRRCATGDTANNDVYRAITFTQGIIEQVDHQNDSIVLRVDPLVTVEPSNDFFDKTQNPLGSGYLIDAKVSGRSKFNAPLRFLPTGGHAIKGASNANRHRVFFKKTEGMQKDDRLVIQRRGQQIVIGIFRGCNRVTIDGVVAYSSPATFISAGRSDNINIIDTHAKIKPGRWKGINADAIHIQGNRQGVWVEDCSFTGVGDDIANLYSLPSAIVNVVSATELEFTVVAFDSLIDSSASRYQRGDKVIFYEPITGRSLKEARVVSAEVVRGTGDLKHLWISRVKFDQPVPGIIAAGNDDRFLRYRNDIQVFNRELAKNGLLQNTSFTNSRRYGIFLMAENVEVADNDFTGLNSTAIAGHNQTGWPLGNLPRDILIQNNTFRFNGFSNRHLTNDNVRAVVSFKLDRLRDRIVNRHSNLISNLTIADNRFLDWGKTALSVRNAQHVRITGNHFQNPMRTGMPNSLRHVIEIAYGNDVQVLDSKQSVPVSRESRSFLKNAHNRGSVFQAPQSF